MFEELDQDMVLLARRFGKLMKSKEEAMAQEEEETLGRVEKSKCYALSVIALIMSLLNA